MSCRNNNGGDDSPKPTHVTTPYQLNIPEGFPMMTVPEDNPLTVEGVQLGRRLFYEPLLSGDNTISCAACHLQESNFSDPRRLSIGIDGLEGKRQSMPIINLGWGSQFFWDGRAASLEQQALGPVLDPLEMHEDWTTAVAELQATEDYPGLFFKAFGTETITKELVTKAIAQFERTLISGNSRYDKVIKEGNGVFFTDDELNGFDLFNSERGDCFHCHSGILFTDNLFHNNGLDANPIDKGLEKVTGKASDIGKFKTPTLRNIAVTAPYMHDGRFNTLKEVLDHYSDGVKNSPTLDPLMNHMGGIELTEQEKVELIAFLKTLTDEDFLENPDFSNPHQ